MTAQELPKTSRYRWLRLALRIVLIGVFAFAIHLLIDWMTAKTQSSGNMPLMIGLLAVLLLTYALVLAVPFAPGIEIGITLLVLRGAEIAPFVYLATVLGLSVAFLVGRFLPYAWLHGVFSDLRMYRVCRLVEHVEPKSREERLAMLSERLPPLLRPVLGQGRYILLAVVLNVPGNMVLGGGGGLAFLAGFSRLYSSWVAILVIALAVLPVPLLVWIHGARILADA